MSILCAVSLHSHAATYEFETVVNGVDPGSVPPWLTASIETLSPGMVNLTIQLHLESTSEFVSELALNLSPNLASQTPQFQQTGGIPFSSILFAPDSISLSGAGSAGRGFDISLSWPSQIGARFDLLETASFLISSPGLVAEDFEFTNPGGLVMAAHIQGISSGSSTFSGVISATKVIPEPSTSSLWLLGFTAFALSRSRRVRHKGARQA
jgi:hypothetical protein